MTVANASGTSVHPLLAAAFDALDYAEASWCVLRGEAELDRPRDVDLLVPDGDLARATPALAELGFVRLPAVGHGLHRFFVTYDEETGAWLRLDVVRELGFGKYGALASEATAGCLGRAMKSGPVRLLARDDAFWTLLVRCLLDLGEVPLRHAPRVQELAHGATDANPLALELEPVLPAGWTVARVRTLAEEASWSDLSALAPEVSRRWARRRPAMFLRRRAAGTALRLARPLFTALRARGISLALLGPDGSGKSTLVDSFAEAFTLLPVRTVYLGLYSDVRTPGRSGRLGWAVRLAWLVRARPAIAWHVLRGRVVACDRHTLEALLGEPAGGTLGRVRRRLVARAAPRPDVLIVLDAPAHVLAARKPEHTAAELEEQRQRYRELARRVPGAVVLDTAGGLESAVRGIVALLWTTYTQSTRSGMPARRRQ